MRPTHILSLLLLASTTAARATPRNHHVRHQEVVTLTTSKTTTICSTSTRSGNHGYPTHSYTWGSSSNHTHTRDSSSTLSTSQTTTPTSSTGSVSSTTSLESTSSTSTSQSSSSQTSSEPPIQTPPPTCDASEEQPNLAINPSFEEDLLGTGQHASPWVLINGDVVGPESDLPAAEDGEYRVFLSSIEDGTASVTQQINDLIPGAIYTVTFAKELYVGSANCGIGGCSLIVRVNGVFASLFQPQSCQEGNYGPAYGTFLADGTSATVTIEWDCVGPAPGGVLIDNVNVARNCTAVEEPPMCSSVSFPNPYTSDNGNSYLTTCGTFPTGDVVQTIEGFDFESCVDSCDNSPDTCIGLSYSSQLHKCLLLSTVTGSADEEFVDGATLIQPAQPTVSP